MKNILPILWEKLGPPSFCVTNYVLLWGYHLKIKHLFFFFSPNSIYMEKKIAQKNSVCESSQFCLAQQGQGRQSTQLNTKRNSPLQLEYFYFLSTSFLPFFFFWKDLNYSSQVYSGNPYYLISALCLFRLITSFS